MASREHVIMQMNIELLIENMNLWIYYFILQLFVLYYQLL
jgi:hypothetical protein